jgi:hypothetical protein
MTGQTSHTACPRRVDAACRANGARPLDSRAHGTQSPRAQPPAPCLAALTSASGSPPSPSLSRAHTLSIYGGASGGARSQSRAPPRDPNLAGPHRRRMEIEIRSPFDHHRPTRPSESTSTDGAGECPAAGAPVVGPHKPARTQQARIEQRLKASRNPEAYFIFAGAPVVGPHANGQQPREPRLAQPVPVQPASARPPQPATSPTPRPPQSPHPTPKDTYSAPRKRLSDVRGAAAIDSP